MKDGTIGTGKNRGAKKNRRERERDMSAVAFCGNRRPSDLMISGKVPVRKWVVAGARSAPEKLALNALDFRHAAIDCTEEKKIPHK